MLLQSLFLISAGFSRTALRQPCASAACRQLELRSCASADADKRRFVGRRLGGRAINKLTAKTPAKGYLWASCLWAGFTRGDVWAANDILSDDNPDVVAVKKHTKGTIIGPSKLDPLERLEVSWEHWLYGKARELITSVKPLDLTSREPPLPGGFTRGAVVWAADDFYLVGGEILAVKKHTKGCIAGPSKRDPSEWLQVSFKYRADGGTNYVDVIPGALSREPPLPGGFTRGGDVWATRDIYLVGGEILTVRKHTKGTILGPSNIGPSERLQVSWEHCVDSGTNHLNTYPDALTSREPPLPGGFTRGDVWAARDLYLKGGEILAVKKHTKGTIIGPAANFGASEWLTVSWEYRADRGTGTLGVVPKVLTAQEPAS